MELQTTGNQNLSNKQPATSLPPIQIGKNTDLLKAAPIVEMIREHGEGSVLMTVVGAVTKCALALDIKLVPDLVEVIAEDLVDKYKNDSVEDIIECLKKGRRGMYPDSKTYGKLNMEVVSGWMTHHLEDKYQAKENQERPHDIFPEVTHSEEDKVKIAEHVKKFKKQLKDFELQTQKGNINKKMADIAGFEKAKRAQYERVISEVKDPQELQDYLTLAKEEGNTLLMELIEKEI